MSDVYQTSEILYTNASKYLNCAHSVKLLTQDMMAEAEMELPFPKMATRLTDISCINDVTSYRLTLFMDSSSKAVLVTIMFGALKSLDLDEHVSIIGEVKRPGDHHQWLSCVSLVRDKEEAFNLIKVFVEKFHSSLSIQQSNKGWPMLTINRKSKLN